MISAFFWIRNSPDATKRPEKLTHTQMYSLYCVHTVNKVNIHVYLSWRTYTYQSITYRHTHQLVDAHTYISRYIFLHRWGFCKIYVSRWKGKYAVDDSPFGLSITICAVDKMTRRCGKG